MIPNFEVLMKNLQSELEQTHDSLERTESLERLKAIGLVYKGSDEMVTTQGIIEKLRREVDEFRILTGWDNFDKILKGFRLQQLVTVSAATKSGKTSFLMDFTTKIKEFNPTWFPFEESAEELIRKYLERGEEPPHFITPLSVKQITMNWLETKIVESIAKYNTKVVIVDHLDFIIPFGMDNHALRMGQAMRDLKGLAKKWNIVIFIVCHLVKTRMESQPTLEDLRGSSSIAQESDTVILLWREMRKVSGQVEISNNVNVSVQANRRTGTTGNVKMTYDNGKFYEKDWSTQSNSASDNF